MKRSSNAKKTLLLCAQKMAERELMNNAFHGWPHCGGVIHQPKRPEGCIETNDVKNDKR